MQKGFFMWEISIEASKKNVHLLNYISNKLQNSISFFKGIQSLMSYDNSISLAVGCPKQYANQLKNFLKILICDAICYQMKFDYLKNHINLVVSSENLFNAFIKVYTYFDSELERKIVLRILSLNDKIVLESFLYFKLQPLLQKWKEMCNLANSNLSMFLESQTFLELLKFLISNMDIKVESLIIDLSSSCQFFEERKNKLIFLKNFNEAEDFEIITGLIEFSPSKIKIISGKNHNLISLIANLYEGRVEILK